MKILGFSVKADYKQIRGFLVIGLIAAVLTLVAFKSVEIGQSKLSGWMYKEYTQPFLDHNVITHSGSNSAVMTFK